MRLHTLTIVGVGLIGGSIGLAVKKRGIAERVIGVGRDPDILDQALQLGAIDECLLDLPAGVSDADFVVFCTPVDHIAEQITEAAAHCPKRAILTDAGSTKRDIVAKAPAQVRFVGGHPLAGSEKKGVVYAHADLFIQRTVVLTPTHDTPEDAVREVARFWESLGGVVRLMSPEQHDQALALTSHLPHLVASALAGLLPSDWRDLTATGFRDTTRVASGDPEVWSPIFQQNRAAVLAALDQLEGRLKAFRHALTAEDVSALDQFLAEGKRVRDALGN